MDQEILSIFQIPKKLIIGLGKLDFLFTTIFSYFAKQNKNLNQFLGEHSYKNHLKLIKSIASKSKIKFFDMNIFFKRKSSYKDELFVDNIHLNNEGNNLVSECIKSLLK